MGDERRRILEQVKVLLNVQMEAIAAREGLDWSQAREAKVDEAVELLIDAAIDKLREGYRSLEEVQQIVNSVRAGHNVQIAYGNPGEEDDDECIIRPPCW